MTTNSTIQQTNLVKLSLSSSVATHRYNFKLQKIQTRSKCSKLSDS